MAISGTSALLYMFVSKVYSFPFHSANRFATNAPFKRHYYTNTFIQCGAGKGCTLWGQSVIKTHRLNPPPPQALRRSCTVNNLPAAPHATSCQLQLTVFCFVLFGPTPARAAANLPEWAGPPAHARANKIWAHVYVWFHEKEKHGCYGTRTEV